MTEVTMYPSQARQEGVGSTFSDIINITKGDDSLASTPNSEGVTKSLIGYDFGFDIPNGSEILNLACTIKYSSAGAKDNSLYLVNPGNVSLNKADPDHSLGVNSTYSWSGDSSFWGVELTTALLNSAQFGVSYSGRATKAAGVVIYWYTLTVVYSDIITGKISVRIAGNWDYAEPYVKLSGGWKKADEVFVRKNGLWVKVYG